MRGFLHRAAKAGEGFLVLTHGAGGNCGAPLLVVLAEKFAISGSTVLRCDLPYRQRRPRGAPSPADAKTDQAGLRRAVDLMKHQFEGRAFLGGSSYGGRQASMLVAAEPSLVEGLLLLSYPLHPPGRPAQLRTAHFPNLTTPTLFVSGTRDTFGSIEELEGAIKLIPAGRNWWQSQARRTACRRSRRALTCRTWWSRNSRPSSATHSLFGRWPQPTWAQRPIQCYSSSALLPSPGPASSSNQFLNRGDGKCQASTFAVS